jgi:hypothetical protein
MSPADAMVGRVRLTDRTDFVNFSLASTIIKLHITFVIPNLVNTL